MSQALRNKVGQLESRVAELEQAMDVLIQALEQEKAKRKPGRPKKDETQ